MGPTTVVDSTMPAASINTTAVTIRRPDRVLDTVATITETRIRPIESLPTTITTTHRLRLRIHFPVLRPGASTDRTCSVGINRFRFHSSENPITIKGIPIISTPPETLVISPVIPSKGQIPARVVAIRPTQVRSIVAAAVALEVARLGKAPFSVIRIAQIIRHNPIIPVAVQIIPITIGTIRSHSKAPGKEAETVIPHPQCQMQQVRRPFSVHTYIIPHPYNQQGWERTRGRAKNFDT